MGTSRPIISWLCACTMLLTAAVTPASVWCITDSGAEMALASGKECTHEHPTSHSTGLANKGSGVQVASFDTAILTPSSGSHPSSHRGLEMGADHTARIFQAHCNSCIDLPMVSNGVMSRVAADVAPVLGIVFYILSIPPTRKEPAVYASAVVGPFHSDTVFYRRTVSLLV